MEATCPSTRPRPLHQTDDRRGRPPGRPTRSRGEGSDAQTGGELHREGRARDEEAGQGCRGPQGRARHLALCVHGDMDAGPVRPSSRSGRGRKRGRDVGRRRCYGRHGRDQGNRRRQRGGWRSLRRDQRNHDQRCHRGQRLQGRLLRCRGRRRRLRRGYDQRRGRRKGIARPRARGLSARRPCDRWPHRDRQRHGRRLGRGLGRRARADNDHRHQRHRLVEGRTRRERQRVPPGPGHSPEPMVLQLPVDQRRHREGRFHRQQPPAGGPAVERWIVCLRQRGQRDHCRPLHGRGADPRQHAYRL